MPPPGLRDIVDVLREQQLLSGPSQYVEGEQESRFLLEELLCKSPSSFSIHNAAGMWLICCDEPKPVIPS